MGRNEVTADPVVDEPPISLYASSRPRWTGRRGTIASTVSTVVVIGLVIALLASPSAKPFREGFLNPHQMWIAFTGDPAKGILSVGKGFLLNVYLSVICEAVVLVLALGIAALRLSRGPVLLPLRGIAIAYTDFGRGVPVILVMLWVGSGILSVPANQTQAAKSLALPAGTTLRRVVLPQAIRNVLPALLNDFASLQKDTAIVSTLGVAEAVHSAQIAAGVEFNYSSFTVASLLFLALTVPLTRYTDRIMAKDRTRRLAGIPDTGGIT